MSIALVTGASRGIGKAAALALARDGWTVHVNYIQSQAAAEAVAAQTGGLAIRADVSDAQAVAAMENPPALYYYLIHADRTDIWPERDAEWFRLPPMAADHPLLRCAAERRPLPDGFPPAEKYSLIQSYTSQDPAAYNGYLLAFAKNDELVFRVERLPSRT